MTERPLILCSNDDGIDARGIQVLADALATIADVWVIAPDRERSAIGHAISLHEPLRLSQVAPQRFACSGTPTDCVYIGVNHVLPRTPDMVVSGINAGANLGDDVTYSGTVGAAMEGMLMGIPAIATSLVLDERGSSNYEQAAAVTLTVVRDALAHGIPRGTLLNLNVPDDYDIARGVRLTKLGRRNYGRLVQENRDPRGRRYYWIGGPRLAHDDIAGSDCNAIHDGYAALTAIHLDLTAFDRMEPLYSWTSITSGYPEIS